MKASLFTASLLCLTGLSAAEPPVQTVEGVPLEVNGATLRTLHIHKKVNVELPTKDYLELSLPLFAYTVRPEYKVQESDAKTLRDLAERLAKIAALPLNVLIQPESLQALRATQAELSAFAESFVKRVDPFDLPHNTKTLPPLNLK